MPIISNFPTGDIPGDATPKVANGAGSAGTATSFSREDHVHPAQTDITGNAGSATKLKDKRTISLTSGVTGSAQFDGTGNVEITATVTPMTGATAEAAGTAGAVPAPQKNQQGLFLNGAGQWATPTNTTYSDMGPASGEAAGTHGLVPAPKQGDQAKFLNGAGKWDTPTDTKYNDMVGASSSAAGTHGLVPAPQQNDEGKFLNGAGKWAVPANTDTKVNMAKKSAKSYLLGTTTAPGDSVTGVTAVADSAVYMDAAAGNITATIFTGALSGKATSAGTADTATKLSAVHKINLTGDATASISFDGSTDASGTVTIKDMGAASSSAEGSHGLVPKPGAGAEGKFLRGDGTWQVPVNTTYQPFKGANGSAAGGQGLVPTPQAADNVKFLRGDGSWQVPANTDTKVTQQIKTDSVNYPVMLTPSGQSADATTTACFTNAVTINPSTKTVNATTFNGKATTAGTADAATKLAADRKINGVVFNGTGDITVADNTKLPLTGGTVTGPLVEKGGTYVWSTGSGENKAGNMLVAEFQINTNYANGRIVITAQSRSLLTETIEFGFTNGTSIDKHDLLNFRYYGDSFLCLLKTTTSGKWQLYAKKSENYDTIEIVDFQFSYYMQQHITWTWKSSFVETMPTGVVWPTPMKAASSNTADTLTTARNLKVALNNTGTASFNGSANVENIPVTGTLAIANGGTGAADATAARNALGAAGKPTTQTVTITASNLASKSYAATVNGVSATETAQLIIPVPALASQKAYMDAGVKVTGQAANQLTFTCDTAPTATLTVYVVIIPLT